MVVVERIANPRDVFPDVTGFALG